ncbi:MAG: hypothetical protein AAFN30_05520 [Actinomycetota bacterium]
MVARLAERIGAIVDLTATATGGVSAEVTVPATALAPPRTAIPSAVRSAAP